MLKRYYQRELTDLSNDDAMDDAAEATARSESQHEASTSGRDDGSAATNGGNAKADSAVTVTKGNIEVLL